MNKIQDVREAAIPQNEDSLTQFQVMLEDFANELQDLSEPEELCEAAFDRHHALIDRYCIEADPYFPANEKEEEIPSLEGYLWDYFLPERMKNLSILMRDSVLQLLISQHLLAEKKKSKEQVLSHFQQVKELLIEALQTTGREMAGEIQVLKTKDGALDRKFEDVLHIKNPWGIYKAQLGTLLKQIKQTLEAHEMIKETIMTFTLIHSNLERMGFDIKKQNLVFRQKTQECEQLFEDLENSGRIDQALNWLETVLEDLVKFEGKQEHQVRVLEGWLESLKQFTVPVGTEDGLLITKTVDFKKTTTKWLDYFILPDIIELWEDQEAIISRVKSVISQVRGSLTVALKSDKAQNFNSDRNVIHSLLEGIQENSRRATSLLIHIEETIKKDFSVTSVYAEQDFLKVPLQTTFGGFKGKNNSLGQRLKKALGSLLQKIDRQYRETKDKTPHEELEIALQVIENRTHPDHPDHYHALFLTKNFVGDLFLVPRQEIENQLDEIVAQWKSGKSRSVLLAGAPLSGKSTMAEHLSKADFPRNTILLSPDTDLIVEGRKYRTNHNLKEAFDFIKKSLHNSSPLVVIDDLHLWRDKNTSLLANVKSLLDFISTHGKRALVTVTVSDVLVTHLDSRLPFSGSFTNYFDLNASSGEQIYKAIMLRHGASHNVIFPQGKEEALSDREVQKKIQSLSKKFDYNIGAVLQAWTFCTQVFENERVEFVDKNIQLNDFLSPIEILLLKHCLLYGYGSELEFKSFFEARFDTEIKPAIRRLLNIHILGRNESGQLIVEDLIKQDVYTLLKYKEVFS
ncbi:P-loop NTPase family protein [Algoriphagus namhaensis]